MNLAEAVPSFLRACEFEKNLSLYSLRAYRTDLRQFVEFAVSKGVIDASQVNHEILHGFIEDLKVTKSRRDSSVRRKIAVLRTFYRFLDKRDIIQHSPFAKIRLTFKQDKRLPAVLSRQEVTSILVAVKRKSNAMRTSRIHLQVARDCALLELLFYSGARVSELLKLDVADCDLTNGFAKIKGKGRRERIIYIGCEPVVRALKEWLRCRHSAYAEALFLNRNGKRLSVYSAERIVKKYSKAAGVRTRVTPHVFRHTMATMMLENGADLRSIQEILGHASISTTEIYTHVSTERKRKVMTEFHPRRFFPSRAS